MSQSHGIHRNHLRVYTIYVCMYTIVRIIWKCVTFNLTIKIIFFHLTQMRAEWCLNHFHIGQSVCVCVCSKMWRCGLKTSIHKINKSNCLHFAWLQFLLFSIEIGSFTASLPFGVINVFQHDVDDVFLPGKSVDDMICSSHLCTLHKRQFRCNFHSLFCIWLGG